MLYVCFSLALFSSVPVLAAPEVHVLAVGSNQSFKPGLEDLKFAENDAQRFVEAMRTVGLVPTAQATVLTGVGVEEFRQAVQTMTRSQFAEPQSNRKFVFYFSGHSDDSGLHLHDGLVSKNELHEHLKTIEAHTKIAILDSCFSGAITAKGIRRGEEFELPKVEFDEPTGSVLLSASSGRQFAYESETLESSIFTHHLIAGLYGEADGNNDGLVTVDELYQHVYRNTKWQSLNYPTRSAQEPEFVSDLQGQGAIVLSFPARTNSRLALAGDLQGELTIASTKGMQFFKVQKVKGQTKTLQLPVGSYQVSVRDANRVGLGQVEVVPVRLASLGAGDIKWSSQAMGSLGTVKGVKAVDHVEENSRSSSFRSQHRIAAGVHTGFGQDDRGPMIEYSYIRTSRQFLGLGAEFGGVLHVHRNTFKDRYWGGEINTTSFAAFGYGGVTISIFSLGLGYGQTYHDQRGSSDLIKASKSSGSSGAAPGWFTQLGMEFTADRDFGITYRHESLEVDSGYGDSRSVDAQTLAVFSAF